MAADLAIFCQRSRFFREIFIGTRNAPFGKHRNNPRYAEFHGFLHDGIELIAFDKRLIQRYVYVRLGVARPFLHDLKGHAVRSQWRESHRRTHSCRYRITYTPSPTRARRENEIWRASSPVSVSVSPSLTSCGSIKKRGTASPPPNLRSR